MDSELRRASAFSSIVTGLVLAAVLCAVAIEFGSRVVAFVAEPLHFEFRFLEGSTIMAQSQVGHLRSSDRELHRKLYQDV